jgi:hypothetical protein
MLEGLTPGGSEYKENPQACVERIKAQWQGSLDALRRAAKRNKDVTHERDAALKALAMHQCNNAAAQNGCTDEAKALGCPCAMALAIATTRMLDRLSEEDETPCTSA